MPLTPRRPRHTATMGLVLAFAVAGCSSIGDTEDVVSVNQEQAYRGGTNRAGHTGPFGGDEPEIQWTVADDTPTDVTPVAIGDTDALVPVGSQLARLNGQTGEASWQVDVADLAGSPALVTDGTVVVASADGTLRGLAADSGDQDWEVDLAGTVAASSPLPMEDQVVVGVDADLVAVDAETGETGWRTTLPAAVSGSPATFDDLVIAMDSTGALSLLEGDTGDLVATLDLAEGLDAAAVEVEGLPPTPAINDGTLVVARPDGSVAGVSVADRAVLWTTDVGGVVTSSAAIDSQNAWVATTEGRVVALDPEEGSTNWTTDLTSPPASSPVLTDGTDRLVLVATRDGVLHALDPDDGGERWTSRLGGGRDDLTTDPVVVEDTIVVGDGIGNIIGLR